MVRKVDVELYSCITLGMYGPTIESVAINRGIVASVSTKNQPQFDNMSKTQKDTGIIKIKAHDN